MSRGPRDPRRRQALAWAGGLAVGLGAAPGAALAAAEPPEEVRAEIPGARLHGDGRLRVLGLRIYDARLWSPRALSGADWTAVPLALELVYARTLRGPLIAERSLEEMRRQGPIADAEAARWLAEMTRLFPDVHAGDRLTGIKRPGEAVRIFLNGALRGEIVDGRFARLFFGIWLSDRSSEPALRSALLGLGR